MDQKPHQGRLLHVGDKNAFASFTTQKKVMMIIIKI